MPSLLPVACIYAGALAACLRVSEGPRRLHRRLARIVDSTPCTTRANKTELTGSWPATRSPMPVPSWGRRPGAAGDGVLPQPPASGASRSCHGGPASASGRGRGVALPPRGLRPSGRFLPKPSASVDPPRTQGPGPGHCRSACETCFFGPRRHRHRDSLVFRVRELARARWEESVTRCDTSS